MLQAIDKSLREAGLSYRVVPAELVVELRHRIDELLGWGSLSGSLYKAYASSLEWDGPAKLPVARSLIVIAGPAPTYAAIFHAGQRRVRAIIPPTYVSSSFRALCRRLLEEVLVPAGFGVERPRLPVKLLAVRAGLGEYGRNDLCYVADMGSFARLESFVTDADLVGGSGDTSTVAVDGGRRASQIRMSHCAECDKCVVACPTRCIPSDGSLVDAERCLTYFNENEGAWGDRLAPDAHNSLVGCMRCQQICPVNRPYLREPEIIAEFDEVETAMILGDPSLDQLPESLREKLADFDLDGYSGVLGRNLRALMG